VTIMKLVLTDPEKLRLWRKKNKLSQAELATKLKVHQTSISKMEKGLIPVTDAVLGLMKGWKPALNDGERASILRRRYRKTLADAASAVGIHENQLSEMERGLRRPVADEYLTWLDRLK
jgi:transcriptional regulator with XRE-family HTH domain